MLDALDKKIICMMQDEFPLVENPYQEIAEKIGISEDELLKRLTSYKETGKIRKMGAVLRHREVGYRSNALCLWIVPKERLEEIGSFMAKNPEISHCYDRVVVPDWQYNLYTMVHAHSREECKEIAARLAEKTGLTEYTMLFSIKEWKKTSMRYFHNEHK